jgi:hypothetical protein
MMCSALLDEAGVLCDSTGAIPRVMEPQIAPDLPVLSSSWSVSLHTLGMAIATAGVGIDGRRWCGSW